MAGTLANVRRKWRERSQIWGKNDGNAHKCKAKMAGTLTNEVPQGMTVIKLWFGWGFLLSVCMWKLLGGKTGAARAGAARTAQCKGTMSRDFFPFLISWTSFACDALYSIRVIYIFLKLTFVYKFSSVFEQRRWCQNFQDCAKISPKLLLVKKETIFSLKRFWCVKNIKLCKKAEKIFKLEIQIIKRVF